ncbi:MAG: sigma-54-dependent transcriptional regulator [Candidatus Kapaibacteriota bacterium]
MDEKNKQQYTILIIDDEESQREQLSSFLSKKGFAVLTAANGLSGVEIFRNSRVDLVLTDYKMPDISGEEVLTQIREINPLTPIIIITAYGTIQNAVKLMQKNAFSYLTKPVDLLELLELIRQAKESQFLLRENELIKQTLKEKYSFDLIISNSAEMEEIINTAGRVAKSRAAVLIRGESGTGKELIARAIHSTSDRADKPFVVVNCAALPETLFESELFGHEKGAFTGATSARKGKFEEANNGTLFIDEVGDIPLAIQVKLLRALQFGEIQKLGSNHTIKLDVRIISATNRNLEEMIKNGSFREDLLYRLNVVTLTLPPLKKRKIDIPILIRHFIQKYSELNGKNVTTITSEALNTLMKYDFPGNIRELENLIQRSVVLTRDNIIKMEDLPYYITNNSQELNEPNFDVELGDLTQMVENLERKMIMKALEETNNNQTKAANLLNISERTLRYKLSKYGKLK